MKNLAKQLGIVIFSMMIVFSMTVCDDSGDNGGGGNTDGSLGETLNLSGKVYIEELNYNTEAYEYKVYSGTALNIFVEDIDETGTISASGDFSYTIGTPDNAVLSDINVYKEEMNMSSMYTNVTISDTNVKTFTIDVFLDDSYLYYGLSRMHHDESNSSMSGSKATSTMKFIWAIYIYVSGDVTIKATGKTIPASKGDEEGLPVPTTVSNLDLVLKKGWNIIKQSQNMTMSATLDNDGEPVGDVTGSMTVSVTTGDSSELKWVLQ